MTIPMKLVVSASKPEGQQEEYIPLTPEELAQREADAAQAALDQAQREAEELAKAEAKASAEAKLAALGLTSEDIRALGL